MNADRDAHNHPPLTFAQRRKANAKKENYNVKMLKKRTGTSI